MIALYVFSKTGIIHTRKPRGLREKGYITTERPQTYSLQREPLAIKEPISYRDSELKPRVVMTNKGRKPHINALVSLPETGRSDEGRAEVEKLDFKPKEPKEKREREPISFRQPLKQKPTESSNQKESKTPRDPPKVEEVEACNLIDALLQFYTCMNNILKQLFVKKIIVSCNHTF